MVLQGSGKHHPRSFEIHGQNILNIICRLVFSCREGWWARTKAVFDTTATGQLHRFNVFESSGNTLKFIEEWNEILPELRGVVQLRLVFVQQVHGKLLHGPEIHKNNACR